MMNRTGNLYDARGVSKTAPSLRLTAPFRAPGRETAQARAKPVKHCGLPGTGIWGIKKYNKIRKEIIKERHRFFGCLHSRHGTLGGAFLSKHAAGRERADRLRVS
jgi:hypothetical protein